MHVPFMAVTYIHCKEDIEELLGGKGIRVEMGYCMGKIMSSTDTASSALILRKFLTGISGKGKHIQ